MFRKTKYKSTLFNFNMGVTINNLNISLIKIAIYCGARIINIVVSSIVLSRCNNVMHIFAINNVPHVFFFFLSRLMNNSGVQSAC